MITGGLAPTAWRVEKVFPLANRSYANFPLPCSPFTCNLSQTHIQEPLALKKKKKSTEELCSQAQQSKCWLSP